MLQRVTSAADETWDKVSPLGVTDSLPRKFNNKALALTMPAVELPWHVCFHALLGALVPLPGLALFVSRSHFFQFDLIRSPGVSSSPQSLQLFCIFQHHFYTGDAMIIPNLYFSSFLLLFCSLLPEFVELLPWLINAFLLRHRL